MNLLKSVVCVAIVSLICSSCNKELDTLATINVFDESGNILEGAKVQLYADAIDVRPGLLACNNTALTNSRGLVIFNLTHLYEQGTSGFAVLDIIASIGLPNDTALNDTIWYFGDGVIKIIEEENNLASLTVFPL